MTQTLAWSSRRKPALQSGPKQGEERELYQGEYCPRDAPWLPRAQGSQSSQWSEVHLTLGIVFRSCRCAHSMTHAANRDVEAVTLSQSHQDWLFKHRSHSQVQLQGKNWAGGIGSQHLPALDLHSSHTRQHGLTLEWLWGPYLETFCHRGRGSLLEDQMT